MVHRALYDFTCERNIVKMIYIKLIFIKFKIGCDIMSEPTLVILAAGLGSRYGSLKQIDPIDENGNLIIDFSIYDCLKAGFKKLVFIITREMEDDFRKIIGNRIEKYIEVKYVFQDLNDLPEGYTCPIDRVKPWGTGQAVLSCEKIINGPFAVINADDYYGKNSFKIMYDFLMKTNDDNLNFAMIGYIMQNTLTDFGYVSRGVCSVDENFKLTKIVERTHIYKTEYGAIYKDDKDGELIPLDNETIVSMNFWGFTSGIFPKLRAIFKDFLDVYLKEEPLKSEFFLPNAVGILIEKKIANVHVFKSLDKWFGVTYKDDKPVVMQMIKDYKKDGLYPSNLWEEQNG